MIVMACIGSSAGAATTTTDSTTTTTETTTGKATLNMGILMKGENAVDLKMEPQVAALPKINIGGGESIMGPAVARPDQMVRYIKKHNPNPKLNCSLEDLIDYYYDEAGEEGIRADVAVCQAIKETHFFAFDGDITADQNNYCGLGRAGKGNKGFSFATPQLGVRAHIQHLLAYATKRKPHSAIVDPRYEVMKQKYPRYFGKIPYWTGLNGKWTLPGDEYAEEILWYWRHAKNM